MDSIDVYILNGDAYEYCYSVAIVTRANCANCAPWSLVHILHSCS